MKGKPIPSPSTFLVALVVGILAIGLAMLGAACGGDDVENDPSNSSKAVNTNDLGPNSTLTQGKVLLVDMDVEHGVSCYPYKGGILLVGYRADGNGKAMDLEYIADKNTC